ncbi:hypothetical protein BE221DRAFT_119046 [Ostreococcus tauri]|uniref:Uncharacterized protein n=2 Tax=Ostreococcus tauri TaxID=70448 RepID=A0A1Y5I8W7_OSTTA|nr:hypothetical protein BE221DRAFT_119046 [Ostreococcus tauri]
MIERSPLLVHLSFAQESTQPLANFNLGTILRDPLSKRAIVRLDVHFVLLTVVVHLPIRRAVRRPSASRLPQPLILALIQSPRTNSTVHSRTALFVLIPPLHLRFRAHARLELGLRVEILILIRQAVALVSIEMRHDLIIPTSTSTPRATSHRQSHAHVTHRDVVPIASRVDARSTEAPRARASSIARASRRPRRARARVGGGVDPSRKSRKSRPSPVVDRGMEAKRVVFVSLKPASGRAEGASSRSTRKRALGIEANATWEDFERAVMERLRVAGVRAVYHASTGERVRGVEDVRDIEDLIVEEDEGARMIPEGGVSPSPSRTAHGSRNASASARTETEDDDGKNKPRRMSVMLANVIPGLSGAVGGEAMRKLDSALDAAERGGDDDSERKTRSRFFNRSGGRGKTSKRKRRLSYRRLGLLIAGVLALALWFTLGRNRDDAFGVR